VKQQDQMELELKNLQISGLYMLAKVKLQMVKI
jgi:hypothetical protein